MNFNTRISDLETRAAGVVRLNALTPEERARLERFLNGQRLADGWMVFLSDVTDREAAEFQSLAAKAMPSGRVHIKRLIGVSLAQLGEPK